MGISFVGWTGATVVVAAWLFVSFTAPGPRRAIAEWVGACGLYLALIALFTNLVLRAQASGSTAALIAFGFLLALFSSGFVVSLVQTLLTVRSPGRTSSVSATH